MKRALLNFLYNALLHNDEAVAVHVTVSQDVITIQDDGIGIDANELPYILNATTGARTRPTRSAAGSVWRFLGTLSKRTAAPSR